MRVESVGGTGWSQPGVAAGRQFARVTGLAAFAWKAGPGTIKSRLQEVDAPGRIAWTGTTFGIKAIDVFRLEARDDGTLLTEQDSWDGLLARLFRSRMHRTLQSAIDHGLEALKAEAERRARLSAAA
jgi:hypothetical protein